jgi:DNA-binding LytR/AlgR family response regulator
MMRCVIIEDEPLARHRLRGFIVKSEKHELVAEFESVEQFLNESQTLKYDILFLDIQLGGKTGIALLEEHLIACPVILTTAHHEFALKAFDLHVCDYLLKPFTLERFQQALQKAKHPLPAADHIFIRSEHRLEKIKFKDLLYIEGMRDYRCFHTTQGRILTLQTFTELEKLLPENKIRRIHKSFMVNLEKIDRIEKDTLVIGQVQIPVSRSYREVLQELIKLKKD